MITFLANGVADRRVFPVSGTSTQTGQPQETQSNEAHGSGSKTGAIVGGVLGGLTFVAAAVLLALCCLRRRRRKRPDVYDDDDDGNMAERNPNRPPTAVIGASSQSSRISRVRSTLIPASRFRRQNRSFDLLPGSARQSRAVGERSGGASGALSPTSDDSQYYMPSPYVLPSSVGAADGHSVHLPSGVYPLEPQSPAYSSSNSHSGSRSQSRLGTDGHGPGYGSGVASPNTPVSFWYNANSRRGSKAHSRINSQPLSVTSKSSEAGTGTRQRFILHRDADDELSDAEEVVELPPQYTDRREKDGDGPASGTGSPENGLTSTTTDESETKMTPLTTEENSSS